MKTIWVTGGKGQLAACIAAISDQYTGYNFVFTDKEEVDITSLNQVLDFVKIAKPDLIINTAAYTQVDLAEEEHEKAYAVIIPE